MVRGGAVAGAAGAGKGWMVVALGWGGFGWDVWVVGNGNGWVWLRINLKSGKKDNGTLAIHWVQGLVACFEQSDPLVEARFFQGVRTYVGRALHPPPTALVFCGNLKRGVVRA